MKLKLSEKPFLMIKHCMRARIGGSLPAKRPQFWLRTRIPTLLFQLTCLLFLLAVSTSTWGQFFESPPRIIDDANEDTVFSPNGDGVQDNLIISFVTNGFTGDYRIMIDVHGPGAVGRPDGVFDIDDDWMVIGAVGPGPSEFYPENNPKIIHQEWDGMDRAPSQDAPPSARPVRNGNYEIRVETDAFEDGAIDIINPTYQSSTLVAVVDIDAPQISSTASHLFFSPNSDAIKDTTTITYALSEHLSDLRLEFSNFENQPAIKLTQITRGRQSFVWSGLDGLRTPLIDGVYNLRLRGVDNGGNVTTFDVGAVQIDTKAPTFTQITPSRDAYLKTSIAAIEVEFNLAEQDSPINFDSSVTTIGLQNAGGETVSGIIRSDVTNNRLTLALDNPLDTISENGTYTAVILVADEAGNQAATESSFNFDTVPPTLQRIRSNYGNFPPNGSVNTKITFVEVDLDDNIDDGLNLAASTIALNGPNGAIFGNQTFGGDSTLRWNLEAPIAADGSEDGIYTITISVADRAGNTANFGEISFVYDTQAPRLDSLTPNLEDSSFHLGGGTVYRSQPLLQVVAGFDDGAGSGVDFASSRLEIVRLDETGSGNIFLTGTRHVNPTDGTLAFLLSEPLENQDGTQDGAYTIRVSSADVAGNTNTSRVDLIYDTEAPTIVSVAPERDATVTTLSQVTLVMEDSMSGVDFANTILKLVRDDVEIRGTSSNNGKDTEVLTLSNPLVTDGSDDGEYRIEITTVDRAGNASDLIERRFYFVSQPPEIRLNAPATGVINEFTTIDVQLANYIGTGIDFSPEKSSVVVTRPDGTVLPSASVEADNVNNRLVWMAKTPLPRDGSADGEYTVRVNYENLVRQNFIQDFALIFDTQLPGVAQTTPAPGARVSRLGTVTVEFTPDLSGVDFAAVQVRLLDPNGVPVGTNRSDNGVDVITLRVQDIQTSTTEGIYTIEVTPADRAGNVADSPYLSSFTFAPREPSITLEPTDNAPTNQLRQITATLQDYVGPGIDFDSAETSISVRDALGAVVTAQPIQPNAAELQLTWTVLSPLPRDGSADGTYEVMARFVESPDLVTTSPTTFERSATLVFDTQPAHILSTNPTRNARITHLEHATIELGDDLSGVDFNNTLIQLVDPSNNSIPTNIRNDGEKRITLSFDAFKTDGSADGVYRLEITPVDLAGNVGGLSTVEFVYATLAPEIEMLTPADESVVNRVPEIRALIHDHSGEGIDLKKSMISLSGPDGADVRGVPGDDEERTLTLRLGLPTDGSADGTYTVNLNLVDNLGIEAAYMRHFTYDSVPPKIVTESLPPRENVIDDHRIIVEFEVTDASPALEAGSGVDFDATSVQLQDSNGELIAGEMKDDGVSVITFTSAELGSVGVYTLTIVVADRAGNLSVPQQFTYRDVILPPRVVSFSPAAKSRLNRLTEISAVIEDQSGRGIDFSSTGSTIELHSPDGVLVGGIVTNNGVDTLTFHLIDPLLTDGSEDGVYTIVVQPMDRLGVSGEVRQVAITYDTQSPRVQSVSHIDMTANVSRVKDSVRRIEVELTEANSGIDVGNSYVKLWRHTESDRVLVPGTLDYDDASLLWWQLDSPLARSGEDDGEYTVEVVASDNAGNVEENEYRLLYDTQAPVIGSIQVYVVAGDALELDTDLAPSNNRIIIEFEVTDESPALGAESGVDFDATTIQLQDSNGELIAGDKKDDGEKKITFTSVELTSVGAYTVTITAADYAGNVNVGVPQRFTYRDEIKPPRVVSFSPPAKSRLNRLTEISAVIEDRSGRGIDFSSTGSTVELRSPDDVVVEGNIVNDGVDTITLRLLDPLLTDGSDDGVYVITVQPVDQRRISGEVRQYSVIYDTQKPRVQSVSHIDLTANVSNVRDSVRRVEVELIETGSGIDFERSYVQLWRHTEDERALVPGTLDNDGSLLWLQLENALARNGVDDSAYSVVVSAVDNADNVEEKEFVFLYDTQVPGIDSVKAAATAGNTLEIGTGSVSTVVGVPIHQIHLAFSDGSGSGIDVSQTTAQLIQPDGTAVAATQQDDGMKTVSLRFKPLRDDGTDDGRYFVRVTPIDFSGNTYTSPIEFQFLYSTRKPEVVSTTPAEHESVNFLDSISVVLIDHSGEGIDFDRSTVGLYNAEGILVEGRQNADTGSSAITWDLDRPMSRDGVDDGEYSIRLVAFDGAGNELSSSTTILYDSQIPRIVSVSADTIPSTSIPANELVLLNRSFSQMRIGLSDEHADGEKIPTSGIDFAGTIVQLVGPDNEQIGVTVSDDGETQLIVNFTPLVKPGAYTLEIIPRDLAGNASGHPIQYKFSLNLAKPRVDSLAISGRMAPVAFVNQLDKITAKLVDPNGVGLDLTTGGSRLSVIGPNGVVDGLQEGNGVDELDWTPLHLPVDGTADGRYTVTVTPVDNLGLSGAPAIYEFVLDTQQPALVSVDPINLARAVSYIGGQIFQISAQVGDLGPSGLDISTQTITLQDSNGVFIPADLTTDGDSQILLTLVQPLATNGDDDGEYSIVIDLSDRAGNTFKIEHTFVYDTQAPTLVDTDPAGDLIRDDLTSIVAHLSDNGGSGIDFAVSQLMLFDPNGNQVNGQLGNDGAGQLILLLDELAEDGSYRIRVVGVDRAGNGTDAPFERTFLFSTNLPTVVSTVPVTAPAGSAFTRTPPDQVEVEFQSSPNLSTVKLIHPNGTTVPGQQIRDGNRLVYRLSRELASDGSDDGSYVILVTPVNSAGRSGEQLQYSFVYDSVVPEVEGILPVVESPGVNNALNEILVLVTDASPSSSIDWDELDDSWVTFEKIGINKKIRGRLTTDRDQLISFHLESPLASDGSQDGKYRVIVMPRDRAGNVAIPTAIEFFLDTRPPTIHTDSLLINDRPLFVSTNHPDYPSADGSGSGVVIQARMSDVASDGEPGLGVDLSQSSIVVTAPDDTPVTGNLIQNGTDTIVFRSGPLIAEGFYRVEITSVGLDVDGLGFAPTGSITTQFLHETTEPVAELTDFGGKTSLTDQALPLRGTATDPISIAQEGIGDEQGGPVSASGIAFVEIVGTGPDGEPIEPVLAVDRSGAQSEPWSSWSLDFLPARSGGYNLDVRVTDRAGNVAVYDGVTVNLSVSLTYRGTTYSWPSPLKRSTGDRAHFSFDVNIPSGSKINMTLSIYDFAGDLVFEDTFANISPGRDSDQLVTWNLKNQAGAAVARGIYIFRLEAEDIATKNRSNAVGKILVIE